MRSGEPKKLNQPSRMVPFAVHLRLRSLVWETLRLSLTQCKHSVRRHGRWRLPNAVRRPGRLVIRDVIPLYGRRRSRRSLARRRALATLERIRKVEHDRWAGIASTAVETTCTLSGRIHTRKKPRKTEILLSRLTREGVRLLRP